MSLSFELMRGTHCRSIIRSTLNICGPSDPAKRAQLEPLLRWATPGQRGFSAILAPDQNTAPGSITASQKSAMTRGGQLSAQDRARLAAQEEAAQKALELSRMIAGLAKVDDAARRSSVLVLESSIPSVLFNSELHVISGRHVRRGRTCPPSI